MNMKAECCSLHGLYTSYTETYTTI